MESALNPVVVSANLPAGALGPLDRSGFSSPNTRKANTSPKKEEVAVVSAAEEIMMAAAPVAHDGPVRCPHHAKKDLEIFCKVCKVAICSTCTYTRHGSCPATFISTILKESNGQIPLMDMSPFEAIEKTATDLSRDVTESAADVSESKESSLRTTISEVAALNEDLENQLARLVSELEADRDMIIQEATLRCQQHVDALKSAAAPKQATLATKKATLTEGADILASHRNAALDAIKNLPVDEQAVPLVETCLKMMETLKPMTKVEEALSVVEKANLELYLPGADLFLDEIRTRGWAGALEVDAKACTLSGPAIVAFPSTTVCNFTLNTNSNSGEELCGVGGPLVATAKMVSRETGDVHDTVAVTMEAKNKGMYNIAFPVKENMAGFMVEVEVTIGGRVLPDSPKRVFIAKNSLGSTIFTEPNHETALEALNGFLPGRKLNLLYRASRDGWTAADFHKTCDNQGATVTIVKTNNGSIFGGYTSESWDSSSQGVFKKDATAFLFSLENGTTGPVRIPLKKGGESKAIFCFNGYGPAFGHSPDILITGNAHLDSEENSYSHLGSTYKIPSGQNGLTFLAGSHHFLLTEMEVYSL